MFKYRRIRPIYLCYYLKNTQGTISPVAEGRKQDVGDGKKKARTGTAAVPQDAGPVGDVPDLYNELRRSVAPRYNEISSQQTKTTTPAHPLY